MKTVDDGGHLDSMQAEETSVSRVRIQDQLVVLDPNRGSSEGPAAREKMSDKTHKDWGSNITKTPKGVTFPQRELLLIHFRKQASPQKL